jgi:uncharacterized protein (DUF3084 family)
MEQDTIRNEPLLELHGQLVAERDQLTAAYNENRNVLQQIREELANREAAQQQILGSIRTLNKLIGPEETNGA